MSHALQAVGLVLAEAGTDSSHLVEERSQPIIRLAEAEGTEVSRLPCFHASSYFCEGHLGAVPAYFESFAGFQKGQGAGKLGAADKKDGKKRKPYTVNGKTVMMTGLFCMASFLVCLALEFQKTCIAVLINCVDPFEMILRTLPCAKQDLVCMSINNKDGLVWRKF